jgi:competence protein ComEA
VKRFLPLLAAAVVAAAVLLRPVPPPSPTAGASGWSSASDPDERAGGPGRRTPPPHAMVYVAGEVVHPGVYAVGPDARIRDALKLAGGTRPGADALAVNLAAHVRDGDEIAVPVRGAALADAPMPPGQRRGRHAHAAQLAGDVQPPGDAHPSGRRHGAAGHGGHGRSRHGRSRHADVPPVAEVDINTADAETLATIPGIGDGLAKRIVMFREQNGAFASVDELLDVAGITEHRLDAMIPYVVAL